MEDFKNAGAVSLCSHHNKYLIAGDNKRSVCQSKDGSADCAKWTVEHVGNNHIRLKSCYRKYLTALPDRYFMGGVGKKVSQSRPPELDSSVAWKPIKYGRGLKLQTASGSFLRANEGPPYGSSVTHDVPFRSSSQDTITWKVEILETRPHDGPNSPANPSGPTDHPGNTAEQQVKPGVGNSGIQALVGVSAVANIADAAANMADHGQSHGADGHAEFDEERDVVYEEAHGDGPDPSMDTLHGFAGSLDF